jgi:GNAT superfamily N-acetyltransferase
MRVRELKLTERDFRGVATARVEGWRYAYAGLVPLEYLDAMSIEEQVARWQATAEAGGTRHTHLVAEDPDGSIAGWACVGAPGDADAEPGDSELHALYARPDRIGGGVGRALTAEVLRRARATAAGHGGTGRVLVWVLEGNALGRRFYERVGFTADGTRKEEELAGASLPHLRYRLPLGTLAAGG